MSKIKSKNIKISANINAIARRYKRISDEFFNEGTSYAILLGNMFAPLFDETIGKLKLKLKGGK